MPRPTAAQIAYGSCTVIFCTLAMLLLSQTNSGPGIVVIVFAALALGLLVAMTVPAQKPASAAAPVAKERGAEARFAEERFAEPVPARRQTVAASAAASSTPEPVREPAGP
ncbi:hypothetical protein [Streptomyces sporangiiformans]|uniref:Uncharacterized protein n=1 Tax=Streptomyces sporangiiformans TaxID=2315329 RepID=A0A505DLE5_9ACTN|nr:hypothetical protein [Streptomyces sporangiiformans]TPQ20269.1 hypothetical protein FGD71_021655 [Streptomyces sporangiiformans]